MKKIITAFAFGTLTLGLVFGVIPHQASAQIAGDQYFEFEREDTTPRGADDSTTGARTITAEEAGIALNPTSLSWSGDPAHPNTYAAQTVTITNTGRLLSLGQTTAASRDTNFTIVGNSCTRLTSGQSCQVQVAPRSGQTGSFTGGLNISTESGKSARVDLSANITPPPPPEPLRADIRDYKCYASSTNGSCSISFNMWDHFDRQYAPDEIDKIRIRNSNGNGGGKHRTKNCFTTTSWSQFGPNGGSNQKREGGGKHYWSRRNMNTATGAVSISAGAGGWGGCGCRGCIDRVWIELYLK